LYGALVKSNECSDGRSGSAAATLAVAVRTPDGFGGYRESHRATETAADAIAKCSLSPASSGHDEQGKDQ
jgi:hypothetical protein